MKSTTKLSRNDPCWCGSGKKYKQCHMRADKERKVVDRQRAPISVKQTPKPRKDGIIIKTPPQVEGIRQASQLTKRVLDMVAERIEAGVSTLAIDEWVYAMITEAGATPATLGYHGFPASVCTSINHVVCHGIPAKDVVLKDGDIINVDVTSIVDGYFGDASRMFLIGDVSERGHKIVDVAKECLDIGIDQVKPGADFGAIGFHIAQHARKHGFSVVRDFGGHGVGLQFHEEPHVTHFGPKRRGIIMKPNMVFTIEPMINEGTHRTRVLGDGWTAVTGDGKLSAQWEHTVVVTDTGVERLTA